jgi:hypothetical protein
LYKLTRIVFAGILTLRSRIGQGVVFFFRFSLFPLFHLPHHNAHVMPCLMLYPLYDQAFIRRPEWSRPIRGRYCHARQQSRSERVNRALGPLNLKHYYDW